MPKVHSHYENLKVARDASSDEIRAAYRVLTRKHHPDRNPDNLDAQRVMSVINVAYGALSDPVKRSEHDRWIAQSEAPPPRPVRGRPTVHTPTSRYQDLDGPPAEPDKAERLRARQALLERRVRRAAVHVMRHRIGYAAGGVAAIVLLIAGASSLLAPGLGSPAVASAASAVQAVAGYVRAETAPNGHRWPASSGYVGGYQQINQGGLSEIAVDNAQNDSDMFVKLVSLDGPTAFPVRFFFVAARSHFTLAGLTTGTYDLRYRNLASGGLLRSPAFILEEVATTSGTQPSALTVKLYKASEGGMQTYALGDAEF